MRILNENDNILIEYDSQFKFPPVYGFNEKFIRAKIIHTPSNTGDFWIFESLEDGLIFYQNPMDSNFVRIYKLEDYDAIKERQISKSDF